MRLGVCRWVRTAPLRDADVLALDASGDDLAAGGLAFLRESLG
ncbi:MAG: hypothetical protein ACJ77E_00925 [Gaiellaceae bacterium]